MKLTIPIEPVAKGRPRMTRTGHTYTPQKTRDFETEFRAKLIEAVVNYPVFIDCPVKLTVTFYLSKPKSATRKRPCVKPDLDNLIKSMDAANGILWCDDAQITSLIAVKQYGDPRIEIEVECCDG